MGTTTGHGRRDLAHHHPRVVKNSHGWTWSCECGGGGARGSHPSATWHAVVVDALGHATQIAA